MRYARGMKYTARKQLIMRASIFLPHGKVLPARGDHFVIFQFVVLVSSSSARFDQCQATIANQRKTLILNADFKRATENEALPAVRAFPINTRMTSDTFIDP